MRSIYLDYSTSTPIAASVRESMLPYLGEIFGQPSNHHWLGRAAEEAIEDARSNLSSLLGCHPAELAFTSGGTESINLGILGVARAISGSLDGRPHLITTQVEHPAVHYTVRHLEQENWDVTWVPCQSNGTVRPASLERAIRPETRLMTVISASHVTGVMQPVSEIAEICHRHDVLLHTDASQSVGKVDCNVERLGVDLLSLSGHKFYAPVGIGALYLRLGVPVQPLMFGEGGEAGLRPGSANVPHIVGLGQAAKLALAGLESSIDRVTTLRDRLHEQLEQLTGRRFPAHGAEADRVPGILSIELPGVTAEAIQRRLPEICFGPTVPCQGRQQRMTDTAFAALGLSQQQAANTLRISLGWSTSEDDLIRAAQMIATAYEALAEC